MKSTIKTATARGGITNAPTFAGNLPHGWTPAASIKEAEFLALPRARERCRFSGLSRTTLCELLGRGDIKGITIRRPGAVRGKRLIVKLSLAEFLHGLARAEAKNSASESAQDGEAVR